MVTSPSRSQSIGITCVERGDDRNPSTQPRSLCPTSDETTTTHTTSMAHPRRDLSSGGQRTDPLQVPVRGDDTAGTGEPKLRGPHR